MKTLVFVTLMMLGLSAQTMHSQDSHAADEAAMRDAVKQMETGWNTKSGAVFAKPFADDADYVVINGNYIKGRAAIETGHQRIFDTIYKGSHNTMEVEKIRPLSDNLAIVFAQSSLQFFHTGVLM